MATTGKPNHTGRSSGAFTRQQKKVFNPPKDEPWVWLPTELMASAPWRAMGINTRKLIDFLMVEHRNHAALENGNLKATYDQLAAYGLTRCHIAAAIDDAVALGLLSLGAPERGTSTPDESLGF